MVTTLALLVAAALPLPLPLAPVLGQDTPVQRLGIRAGDSILVFWRSDSAPARFPAADPRVARTLRWSPAGQGVEQALLRLSGTGESWRTGAVLVRLDPAALRPRLVFDRQHDGRMRPWSTSRASRLSLVAFNAGQFTGSRPWGWLVDEGREHQPPGHGPLSSAIVLGSDGHVRVVDWADIPAARAAGTVRMAVQSYPALLVRDGEVPDALRQRGRGVDLAHHDSRLAICELRDGRILVALTRFEGLGDALSQIPFGPTLPEMAALMGSLGCARAVALDGGISGQLAIRGGRGTARGAHWPGLRSVPLGIEWVRHDAATTSATSATSTSAIARQGHAGQHASRR